MRLLLDIMLIILFLFFQVLDASWYMPDEQRNPIQEYQVWYYVFSILSSLC